MQLADFDYELPPELIAQNPSVERAGSRMMVLDRASMSVRHNQFSSLLDYLQAGDLLVLNDTRVIPARLLGQKETGGNVEIFLDENLGNDSTVWDCLGRSSRPLKPGMVLTFPEGLTGEVLEGAEAPRRRIRFSCPGDVSECLDRIGHMPLPPYIDRQDSIMDRERYQTVYAKQAGALAAPTAGLHFTDDLLTRIATADIDIKSVTLHVGLGTFLPVRVEKIADHQMHVERYSISEETASAVMQAKKDGRRVVAVGTTVARTLESAWNRTDNEVIAGENETGIFIYPGYKFNVIDILLTNFHLPRSTLLMLISAFAGRKFVLDAYQQAIEQRYRFYSYGDCMLIQ